VTNGSPNPVVFTLQAADGYTTQNGRFSILANPAESVDAGTWIDIQPQIEVAAGQQVVVPFTVSVPQDATPGDHPAGLAALVTTGAGAEGGAGVNLSSRFAVAVMTRVTGELTPALAIAGATAGYQLAWNPLNPGRLTARFNVVNTGNTRLTVTGAVEAGGHSAGWPGEGETIGLMPGESRQVSVDVGQVWPLFRVTAAITAIPVVVTSSRGDQAPDPAPVTVNARAWAMPWPHLAILAASALLLVAVIGSRRRARRRLRQAVADASAKARAEALAEVRAQAETGAPGPAEADQTDKPQPDQPQATAAPLTRKQVRDTRESGSQ
jgi:hypothetical protein